jgi:hypothetical protein
MGQIFEKVNKTSIVPNLIDRNHNTLQMTVRGDPVSTQMRVGRQIAWGIRDIRKIRKRQHQNPEFGHKQGEIRIKPAKKYISIQEGGETEKTINCDCFLKFHPVFLFSWAPPLLLPVQLLQFLSNLAH